MIGAGTVLLPGDVDFSPPLIFGCGQCFRFEPVTPVVHRGVAFGRVLTVSCTAQGVLLDCDATAFASFWHNFFDMDRRYADIRREISVTPFLAAAAEHGKGIRILKQDFWEALCSFLFSQCNNIPRIKGIIARLCERYGKPLAGGYFAFPDAQTVAGLAEEDLRALGAGYRAPYVLGAARAVAEGRPCADADALRALPIDQARHALMALEGVGGKVADCVLLYGLNRLDAFPVDTWMRRALAEHLPEGFDPRIFGEHAGIAQQYIFHYVRHLHSNTGF